MEFAGLFCLRKGQPEDEADGFRRHRDAAAALLAGVPNDRAAVQATIVRFINLQRDCSNVLRRMSYETNDTIHRAFQAETAGQIDCPGLVWKPLFGAQYTEGDALARERQLPEPGRCTCI